MRSRNGYLPPVRQGIVICKLIIFPHFILRGFQLHLCPVQAQFVFMQPVAKFFCFFSNVFAPLAQFVYRIKPVRAFFFHCMQPVRQLIHLLTFFAYAALYFLQLTAQFHEPSRKAGNHAPVFLYRRCKRLFFPYKPIVFVFQRGGLLFAPCQRYAALRLTLRTFG